MFLFSCTHIHGQERSEIETMTETEIETKLRYGPNGVPKIGP